jgi:hypothetical protein
VNSSAGRSPVEDAERFVELIGRQWDEERPTCEALCIVEQEGRESLDLDARE